MLGIVELQGAPTLAWQRYPLPQATKVRGFAAEPRLLLHPQLLLLLPARTANQATCSCNVSGPSAGITFVAATS